MTTKPHTTLSEAVRAMNRAKLLPVWDNINHKLHAELDIIFKALDAAALVEQHEAQEPFGPIVAYASSSEFRRNQLLSKAQYDNCLPKNRVDFDIPLVAVSKCDMCNDNGSVGFPPDDYYPCPKCTPPTLAATPVAYCGRPGTGECSCLKFASDPTNCDRRLEEVATLAATQANAEQDAARYQALRGTFNGYHKLDGEQGIGQFNVSLKIRSGEAWYLHGEELDKHIDAAIRAASKTTPSSGEVGNG